MKIFMRIITKVNHVSIYLRAYSLKDARFVVTMIRDRLF